MLLFIYKPGKDAPLKAMAGHPRQVLPALEVKGYTDFDEHKLDEFIQRFNTNDTGEHLTKMELKFVPDVAESARQLAIELELYAPDEQHNDTIHDVMTASAETLRLIVGKL